MTILAEEALRGSNFRPTFCAIAGGGTAARQLRKLGAEVICLGREPRIPSLAAATALYRTMRALRPDVVHTHGAEANFHGLIAAWLARVQLRVAEEIGIPGHTTRAQQVFGLIYRLAHRIICISDAVATELVRLGEAPHAKLSVVFNPVRLPAVGPCRAEPDCFTILFVGRLATNKNPTVLIPVLEQLLERDIPARLWFAGDGSERDKLVELAEVRGLSSRVTLLGFCDDVAELLSQVDVVVQPSLAEGLGMAVIEAMGAQLPVVATSVGGIGEFLEDGVTGWLVAPDKPAEIAAALIRASELGADGRRRMGELARASVAEMFAPSRYLATIERLYAEELGHFRGEPGG
jgi:glycosyltransferase involved in cell wall biosynthesis